MGKTTSLQIFKSGTHTTMGGQELAFAEADLAATAAAYNPALHEAPLVVGHPEADLPAYGWVQSLAVVNGALEAVPAQVNPAFAEMVASGAYKKISAKFYSPTQSSNPVPGTYYLRHVGFLGAQPPGVKGLRPPTFAEIDDDGECITVELAFAEGSSTDFPNDTTTQESTVTEEEAALLRTQNAQLLARVQTAEATAAAQAVAARHADNTAFAEKLASEARLIGAEVPTAVQLLNDAAQRDAGVEFAEGAKPMAQTLREFFQALPQRVSLTEQAGRERAADQAAAEEDPQFAEAGADPERVKQHKAALAYAKEHQTSYAAAARAVIK